MAQVTQLLNFGGGNPKQLNKRVKIDLRYSRDWQFEKEKGLHAWGWGDLI